jgi:hypothetical protein
LAGLSFCTLYEGSTVEFPVVYDVGFNEIAISPKVCWDFERYRMVGTNLRVKLPIADLFRLSKPPITYFFHVIQEVF